MSATDAKAITRAFFDSLLLEQRLLGTRMPDTAVEIFGERFASPIMTAALSHLGTFIPDAASPMENYAKGAYDADCIHWYGMGENEEFDRVVATGARTIRIVKPYADEDKIMDQLRHAEAAGAMAVGMDIDHWFTGKGEVDVVMGEAMEVKTMEQMAAYVQATKLPFVVKGVLSVQDALRSAEIGARGIVVSHHNGRLACAMPPLMILPAIREAVGPEMTIFVDCGIVSGLDAYKALALGADAVSVGAHLIPKAVESAEAVAARLQEMTDELRGTMAFTGVENTRSFDPTVIHRI